MAAGQRVVVWFRNDLRLHDNAILHEANLKVTSNQCKEVVPVYCFDPRHFARTQWGTHKTGAFRAKFLLESVLELKRSLKSIGSDLLIYIGKPEDILPGVVKVPGSKTLVLTQEEVTSEELGVDKRVATTINGAGKLERKWGPSLFHVDDLPFSGGLHNMPDVFTPFKTKVEQKVQVRKELPTPKSKSLPLPAGLDPAHLAFTPSWEDLPYAQGDRPDPPNPHPDGALDFQGGESAALKRLQYYLWDSNLIWKYFEIRNGMLGGDYSTKFSPWLSVGCLSPRRIYHEIRKYEAQKGDNKSTYWVIFELIWRDFFRFYALKHGSSIFFEGGPAGAHTKWSSDPELWKRWATGATGMPLVDANMRELAATGWMSNRGRQNVASYLALDLGLDWRKGADWFESGLLDYDVCSNWGNWAAAAGVTGGRVNHFNITKQSKDYDPQGDYIRTWCPELKNVPAPKVFEPWLLSREDQQRYGVQIGVDYPNPPSAARMNKTYGGPSGDREGRHGGLVGGRGGGGRGGGSRPSSGRGGGARSGGTGGKQFKKSNFEMYG